MNIKKQQAQLKVILRRSKKKRETMKWKKVDDNKELGEIPYTALEAQLPNYF